LIRRGLSSAGYTVRDVGQGVTGVDLLHDARVLLDDIASPILFDVGANVGDVTLAMLDAFAAPRIVAFEPSPQTVQRLRSVVGARPNVTVEGIALGAEAGTCEFHVTSQHPVNDSLLKPLWDDPHATVATVDVQTIDEYCQRHGIHVIDLLKIDAQGFDRHVLAGARAMLTQQTIRLYSCEANFHQMYDGQATMRDLLEFAEDVGYELVGCYEQTYIRNSLSYLDMLFKARRGPTH
jgi:FkbM family methyltransferase